MQSKPRGGIMEILAKNVILKTDVVNLSLVCKHTVSLSVKTNSKHKYNEISLRKSWF